MNISSSSSQFNPNINEFNKSLFLSEKSKEKIDNISENSSSSPLENQDNISNTTKEPTSENSSSPPLKNQDNISNTTKKPTAEPTADEKELKDEQKEYEKAFEKLEKAFESLQNDLNNGKKIEDLVAVDKLLPLLEDIAKYSSKGLKYMGKGLNFAIDNLPCDKDKQFEQLMTTFEDFIKNYAQLAKVFKATLFVVKYSQTKKLEALLREKTTELRKWKELRTKASKYRDDYHQNLEIQLTVEIKKLEKEILEINEILQVQLKKIHEKFLDFSLSGSIALLKLVKATSSPAVKKFLAYLIWCLSMISALSGTYKGISDTWKTTRIKLAERNQLNRLEEEIRQLELLKNDDKNKEELELLKYCDKTISVCKARISFLRNVRMKETRNKLLIELLETICNLSSTLGTLGALFAVTTVIAGALSTFAGWITILCCIISIISYLSENRIKFRATAEEESRNKQDQLLAEIMQLRIETKALNLERIDIAEKYLEKQIEQVKLSYEYNNNSDLILKLNVTIDDLKNNKQKKEEQVEKKTRAMLLKVEEYNRDYNANLYQTPQKEINDNPPEINNDDVLQGTHSFVENVELIQKIKQEQDLEKLRVEKKQLIAQQIELGGSADDYDNWANEMMEDIKDPSYRSIMSRLLSQMHFQPGTTIVIEEDSVEAFKQIESFIRG